MTSEYFMKKFVNNYELSDGKKVIMIVDFKDIQNVKGRVR